MARKRKNVTAILSKIEREQTSGRKAVLHSSGLLTTNGSGNLAAAIGVANLTSYTDYSDFTGHYDEYRVIGGRLKLYSVLGPGHTNPCSLFAIAFDNDASSSTVPTSTNSVIRYATSRVSNIGRDAKFYFTFETPSNMRLWFDCASPTDQGAILYYATSLSNTTTYVKYELETIVEFRGRR